MSDRLIVRVVDPYTGETLDERAIYDNYCIVTAGECHVAHTTMHANGTHVVTIKDCRGVALDGSPT